MPIPQATFLHAPPGSGFWGGLSRLPPERSNPLTQGEGVLGRPELQAAGCLLAFLQGEKKSFEEEQFFKFEHNQTRSFLFFFKSLYSPPLNFKT